MSEETAVRWGIIGPGTIAKTFAAAVGWLESGA
jgi:hypothetical protein